MTELADSKIKTLEVSIDNLYAILEKDPYNIACFKPQPEELQIFAIERHQKKPSYYKSMFSFCEEYIINPSRKVKLLAVKYAPMLMKNYFEFAKDREFHEIAIDGSNSVNIFNHLVDVDEDLMLKAIEKYKYQMYLHLSKAKSLNNTIIEAFVDVAPTYVEYVGESYLTSELLLRAIKKDPQTILNISSNRRTPELLETAIRLRPSLVNKTYVDENLKMLAVSLQPSIIADMKKPSYELQLKAVEQDGMLLKYIRNIARREVQRVAISQNPDALQYVKKPTLEMKLMAA